MIPKFYFALQYNSVEIVTKLTGRQPQLVHSLFFASSALPCSSAPPMNLWMLEPCVHLANTSVETIGTSWMEPLHQPSILLTILSATVNVE